MSARSDAPHLPHQALIEAYGNGGFRFGGMSHRGSLLSLPDGIWAWPVSDPSMIGRDVLEGVIARADRLDTLIIGTGDGHWRPPPALADEFRALGIALDVMQTRPAVRTYNIMAGERRRVAAALIAIP